MVDGLMSTGDVGRFDDDGRLLRRGPRRRDDRLRGGERLPQGGRGQPDPPRGGRRGRRDRGRRRRLRQAAACLRRRQGQGLGGRAQGPREGATWPASRSRARSSSSTSCRGTRPARSSSASSTPTDRLFSLVEQVALRLRSLVEQVAASDSARWSSRSLCDSRSRWSSRCSATVSRPPQPTLSLAEQVALATVSRPPHAHARVGRAGCASNRVETPAAHASSSSRPADRLGWRPTGFQRGQARRARGHLPAFRWSSRSLCDRVEAPAAHASSLFGLRADSGCDRQALNGARYAGHAVTSRLSVGRAGRSATVSRPPWSSRCLTVSRPPQPCVFPVRPAAVRVATDRLSTEPGTPGTRPASRPPGRRLAPRWLRKAPSAPASKPPHSRQFSPKAEPTLAIRRLVR